MYIYIYISAGPTVKIKVFGGSRFRSKLGSTIFGDDRYIYIYPYINMKPDTCLRRPARAKGFKTSMHRTRHPTRSLGHRTFHQSAPPHQ